MRDIAINVFSGGQSSDADLRGVGEGDWVASRNVINYHIGQNGALRAIMGNTEMDLSPVVLPAGVNTCIGAHEDEQSKSLIWFNHNSNGQHGIYRLYYETSKCDQVLVYTGLDFDVNRKITDIATIDGRYLIWTDAKAVVYDLGGVPQETNEGLQPRCVDMNLATLFGATFQANSGNPYKPLKYKAFLHFNVVTLFGLSSTIRLQIRTTNINGGNSSPWYNVSVLSPGITDGDFELFRTGVYNQLGLAAQALVPGTTFVDNIDHLELTIPSNAVQGTRLDIRITEGGIPSEKIKAYLAPDNHYYFPYVNEQFDLALPMPLDNINAEYGISDAYQGDTGFGKYFQFCYRYIFYDNRRSAWSPYSDIPTNIDYNDDIGTQAVKTEKDYSIIHLQINDQKLTKEWVGYIDRIEIGFRASNVSPVVTIGSFHHWELNDRFSYGPTFMPVGVPKTTNKEWRKLFTADELTTPVASDDIGSTGDTQVLKLYDWVPKRANALASVVDETGTARLVLGGEASFYKNPLVKANISIQSVNSVADAFPLALSLSEYRQENRKFYKKGGRYELFITYYDEKGRTPGAVPIGEVRIPYHNGVGKFYYLKVDFLTPPPSWAKKWRITRTKNLNQAIYKQTPCWEVSKVRFVDKVYYGWGMGAFLDIDKATHLRFQIGTDVFPDPENEILVNIFDNTDSSQDVVWVPEAGHRLQVVACMAPNSVAVSGIWVANPANAQGYYGEMLNSPFTETLDSGKFNFKVVGYQREVTTTPSPGAGNATDGTIKIADSYVRYFALVEKDNAYPLAEASGLLELVNATPKRDAWTYIVELYKPSQEPEGITYETTSYGDVYEDEGVLFHVDPNEAQSIEIRGGDTYHVSPLMYRLDWPWGIGGGSIPVNDVRPTIDIISQRKYRNWYFESATLYPSYELIANDIGRAVNEDEEGKEEYNYQRVRISDAYTPATRINGLSSFRGLNFIDVNKSFGPIMTLKNLRDDLAAVCWNKVQPIYVGKGRVLQLDGVEQIGRSSSLLQLAMPLIEDWGTQNPESVTSDGRRLYGVDKRMCIVWRYSNDGMTPISHYKNLNYFKNIIAGTESSLTTGLNIYSAVHPRLDMFFFTQSDHVLAADTASPQFVPQRTWGFMESDNNWKGEYDFDPEYMKAAGVHMWTFKAGKLYKHHPEATPCNFYGIQFYPEVTFVANKNPGTTKIFQSIRMQSNDKWLAPTIRIPANDPYPLGMLSRLKASNIRNEEGMFVADFLRDINDPDFADIASPSERQTNALLRGRNLRGEVIIVTLLGPPQSDLVRVDTEYVVSMKTN